MAEPATLTVAQLQTVASAQMPAAVQARSNIVPACQGIVRSSPAAGRWQPAWFATFRVAVLGGDKNAVSHCRDGARIMRIRYPCTLVVHYRSCQGMASLLPFPRSKLELIKVS